MLTFKKVFLRVFFAFEALLFLFFYLFGTHGLKTISSLKYDNNLLDNEISDLKKVNAILTEDLQAWHTDPFFKEKIARERLHMARKGDVIFYFDKKGTKHV
jgi:cell division protein FtsB